jgi:hypothetical protein
MKNITAKTRRMRQINTILDGVSLPHPSSAKGARVLDADERGIARMHSFRILAQRRSDRWEI